MALDLHHQDHATKHDQRLDAADCNQGAEDGNETRDQAPPIGTKAPMKTSAASAGATGTPRISATMSTPMLSNSATRIVART